MSTSSLSVANTFIIRFGGSAGIQHMKLQKLAYYCHAWWLTYHDGISFLVEKPEVWQYGPVFSEMYRNLKGFGSQYITEPVSSMPFGPKINVGDVGHGNEELSNFINWIWGNYGFYSSGDLSEKTHAKGTPWRKIAEKHNFRVPRHTPIPNDLIKSCFTGNVEEVLKLQ